MADLRDEVEDIEGEEREAWLKRLAGDWKSANLSELDRGVCAYAEKLTRTPAAMTEEDVEELRRLGLDDLGVHDVIQVASYFNYINRVADGVRVDLEPGMPEYPPQDPEE
jgi:uncharacterized peroxidase-related enzyme